jgi:hypothetical protein
MFSGIFLKYSLRSLKGTERSELSCYFTHVLVIYTYNINLIKGLGILGILGIGKMELFEHSDYRVRVRPPTLFSLLNTFFDFSIPQIP